jgi:hypothetical protein
MNRKDFMQTCAAGVCGCGMMGLLTSLSARADGEEKQTPTAPSVEDQLKGQLDGAHERFAKLLAIMGAQLDGPTRDKILQSLGGECAQDYGPLFNKYRGDLPGFLDRVKSAWLERAEYDEKAGLLRVIGKPGPCACPLAKVGRTPADLCTCSLGWQQAAFSTILGKPVTAEIEETVLQGGSRCSFRIKVQ